MISEVMYCINSLMLFSLYMFCFCRFTISTFCMGFQFWTWLTLIWFTFKGLDSTWIDRNWHELTLKYIWTQIYAIDFCFHKVSLTKNEVILYFKETTKQVFLRSYFVKWVLLCFVGLDSITSLSASPW